MELKIKIRNKEFIGYPKDYILDNGAVLQLATHNNRILYSKGWDKYTSVILTRKVINSIDFSKLRKVEKNNMTYYIIPE